MSDIVERLRDKWQHSEEDCYEAADEIERLSARLAEVEWERDEANAAAEGQLAGWIKADVALMAATARAERLEAALRPLVEACESDFTSEATEAGVGRERDDEPVSFTTGGIGCDLTFGHIRKARAALKEEKST